MADLNLLVGIKVDTSTVQSQLNKITSKPTITTKIKFDDAESAKEVKNYTDKLGNLGDVTKSTSNNGNILSDSITKVKTSSSGASVSLDKTSKSAKDVGDNFNHSSREGKSLGDKFTDITKKVLAFGAVTQVIMLFRQGITEATTVVRDLNDAQTEFSKVSDYSKEQLDSYTDSLDKLGASVYRNKIEMLEGATAFKKSGFSEEDSAILAKVGALYQNIADEQLSASDASEVIISQMKAFNMTADEAIHVINSINEVDVYLPPNNYIG